MTGRQLPLPFAHAPDYAGAPFLAAPCNEAALAWLDRTADWPGGRLAMFGAAGCGKTHLLHRWARAAGAVLRDGASLVADEAGPVAIDDADLAGERALLHRLNAAAEAGAPVLLASRAAPGRWTVALPDLASRLRATASVEIGPPDDALLRALLARLLAERQVAAGEAVQDFLLARLPRTAAAMREAAARLDRASLAAGRAVTRPLAASVVADWEGN